jgi:RNA polymerase sigma-70 factor (ECF subfamily)
MGLGVSDVGVGTFEEHRRLLLGLGYRLLGSMWDAEDVVQEPYPRWMDTDQSQIREPRSFLVTVVARLALDELRSARAPGQSACRSAPRTRGRSCR